MRHLSLGLTIIAGLLPVVAQAQNYIPARNYNGPGIVVNMDVIMAGQTPGMNMPGMMMPPPAMPVAPVYSTNLAPPLTLKRPVKTEARPVTASLNGELDTTMPAGPTKPYTMTDILPKTMISDDPYDVTAIMKADTSKTLPTIHSEPLDLIKPVASSRQYAVGTAGLNSNNGVARPVPYVTDAGALPPPISAQPRTTGETLPKAMPPAIADKPAEIKTAMLTPSAPMPLAKNADVTPIITSAKPADDFEAYRLLFDGNSDALKDSEKKVLDKVIGKMNADPALHLQMHAYANGTPDSSAQGAPPVLDPRAQSAQLFAG